jgi:ribonuclease P protein component
MLPRRYRLKHRGLFAKAMSSGKVLCNTPFFIALGLPRSYQSGTPTRYGFIVSKKVSKKAVVRNKIRRRLSAALREKVIGQDVAKFKPYIAVIFIARLGVLEASYSVLQQRLTECVESR